MPSPPSTQLYTIISLRSAIITFWFLYLFYGLALTLFKHCKSKDFQNANHGKRIQHILEAINIPEAFADWDNNHTLDAAGHRRKWKTVLIEMVWMVVMQFVSNMVLLIPIFVTDTLLVYLQCAKIIFCKTFFCINISLKEYNKKISILFDNINVMTISSLIFLKN